MLHAIDKENSATDMPRIRYIPTPVQRQRLFSLLILISVLAGCSTLEPTPITMQSTDTLIPGKIVWHDLLVEEEADVVPFYTRLFGWSAQTDGRYTVLSHGDRPIAGIAEIPYEGPEPVVARWLASFSTSDVDRTAKLIAAEGGTIHEAPRDLPQRGRFALVSDPQGAKLILLHSKTGDPEDRTPELGDWLWNELWTNDPTTALAFYQKLGGYDVQSVKPGYWVLPKSGRPRAGVRDLPRQDLEIRWVPVVRVADPLAAGDRAVELGGKLLVRAGDPPSDGTVALISDPAGALLMVQSWTGPAQQGAR